MNVIAELKRLRDTDPHAGSHVHATDQGLPHAHGPTVEMVTVKTGVRHHHHDEKCNPVQALAGPLLDTVIAQHEANRAAYKEARAGAKFCSSAGFHTIEPMFDSIGEELGAVTLAALEKAMQRSDQPR